MFVTVQSFNDKLGDAIIKTGTGLWAIGNGNGRKVGIVPGNPVVHGRALIVGNSNRCDQKQRKK